MNQSPTHSRVAPRCPLFVELCAGLGAVSIALQGGPKARPPMSRMGNKARLAVPVLDLAGLLPGDGADAYLWCEPDDGVRSLLMAYPQPEVMRAAADVLSGWVGEDPRELWERLKAEGPIRGVDGREVARWVVVANWAYRRGMPESGFNPGVATGDAWNARCDAMSRFVGALGHVAYPPVAVTPDARAVDPAEVARWVQLTGSNRLIPTAFNEEGESAEVRATFGGADFCTLPEVNAAALRASAGVAWPEVMVAHDSREVQPVDLPEETVAYMDPPYQGTTGYAHDFPREEQIEVIARWHRAGARVLVSEAEDFSDALREATGDPWWCVDVTGEQTGQKRTFSKQQREVVMLNREPRRRQTSLFGGAV